MLILIAIIGLFAKCERIYLNEYQSISELITDVGDYIEFYNHRRFHETLAYKKPMDVYSAQCRYYL
jgi:putative transposase